MQPQTAPGSVDLEELGMHLMALCQCQKRNKTNFSQYCLLCESGLKQKKQKPKNSLKFFPGYTFHNCTDNRKYQNVYVLLYQGNVSRRNKQTKKSLCLLLTSVLSSYCHFVTQKLRNLVTSISDRSAFWLLSTPFTHLAEVRNSPEHQFTCTALGCKPSLQFAARLEGITEHNCVPIPGPNIERAQGWVRISAVCFPSKAVCAQLPSHT